MAGEVVGLPGRAGLATALARAVNRGRITVLCDATHDSGAELFWSRSIGGAPHLRAMAAGREEEEANAAVESEDKHMMSPEELEAMQDHADAHTSMLRHKEAAGVTKDSGAAGKCLFTTRSGRCLFTCSAGAVEARRALLAQTQAGAADVVQPRIDEGDHSRKGSGNS